jgi:hypothetical protein
VSTPHSIMHVVVKVVLVQGVGVSVLVEAIPFASLFQSLTLSYNNSLSHPGLATNASASEAIPAAGARRGLWASSVGSWVGGKAGAVWGGTKNVVQGHAAIDTSCQAASVFSGCSLHEFAWAPPDSVRVGPVSMDGSWAKMEMGASVHLHIDKFDLKHLEIAVLPSVDIKAVVGVTLASYTAKTDYEQNLWAGTDLGNFVFAMGPVPVKADAIAKLDLKAEVSATAKLTVETNVRAISQTTFGVNYTAGIGWSAVHSEDFSHTFDPLELKAVGVAGVKAFVVPTVQLKLDFIGGPEVKFEPYVEARALDIATVGIVDTGVVNNYHCDGLTMQLRRGLDIGVSAAVNVALPGPLSKIHGPDKEWGPVTVFKLLPKTLWSKCLGSTDVAGDSCTDGACPHTDDGDCDDGGPGAEYAVCATGTDCTDCAAANSPSAPVVAPVGGSGTAGSYPYEPDFDGAGGLGTAGWGG